MSLFSSFCEKLVPRKLEQTRYSNHERCCCPSTILLTVLLEFSWPVYNNDALSLFYTIFCVFHYMHCNKESIPQLCVHTLYMGKIKYIINECAGLAESNVCIKFLEMCNQ